MNLIERKVKGFDFFVTYMEQGNNKKGEKVFLVNVFDNMKTNINRLCLVFDLDKHSNIKFTSYNITGTIEYILENITNEMIKEDTKKQD